MTTQRIILAAALVVASSVLAKAETVYVGNAFIVAVSPTTGTCGATFQTGDFFRAVYRPKSGAGNGADSHLALTGTRSSVVMRVPNNNFGSGINFVAQSIGSTNTRSSYGGGILGWDQTVSGDTIQIGGSLARFFNINPCTVTIKANMVRR